MPIAKALWMRVSLTGVDSPTHCLDLVGSVLIAEERREGGEGYDSALWCSVM